MKHKVCVTILIVSLCFSGCTSNQVADSTAIHKEISSESSNSSMNQTTNTTEATRETTAQSSTTDEANATRENMKLIEFGQYNSVEIAYRSEEVAGEMMTIEYYSSSPFQEVVDHYESILNESAAFDITRYPGDAYVVITGTVDDRFVNFSIYKEDNREETYVIYQYDPSSSDMDEQTDQTISPTERDVIKQEMYETLQENTA